MTTVWIIKIIQMSKKKYLQVTQKSQNKSCMIWRHSWEQNLVSHILDWNTQLIKLKTVAQVTTWHLNTSIVHLLQDMPQAYTEIVSQAPASEYGVFCKNNHHY